MKRTHLIDLKKTIKNTLVSFTSIAVFVMLGIALFIGLSWSSSSLRESANDDAKTYKLYDIQLNSLYGFDDEEVEAAKSIDSNVIVNTYNSAIQICEFDGVRSNIQIAQIMPDINQFNYIDGNIPKAINEIAVTKKYAELKNIKIGDTITLEHDSGTSDHLTYALVHSDRDEVRFVKDCEMKYFQTDTFTVTALVNTVATFSNSPIALGISSDNYQIESVFYVDKSAFDLKSVPDSSTLMIHSLELEKHKYYSDEYKNGCNQLISKYSSFIENYCAQKYQKICEGVSYLSASDPDNGYFGIMGLSTKKYKANSVSVLTRLQSGSISSVDVSYKAMHKLRWSLSGMLVCIGLLVTYSVVTRIVFEQKVLIGTKKALGFKNKSINSFYLTYAFLATIIGCVGGFLVGRFIIEPLAFQQVKNNFTISSNSLVNYPLEVLFLCITEVALILFITFIASNRTLKKDAITLLQNSNENKQKNRLFEKTKLWKKMPLLSKTVINNFFVDKKRVFATLIGILSSTALITCGITFSNNLTNSSKYHYDNIQDYDTIVYCEDNVINNSAKKIALKLEEKNIECATVFYTTGIIEHEDDIYSVNIVVAEDEKFDNIFSLKSNEGVDHSITEEAIFINESIANEFELKRGESINVIHNVEKYEIKVDYFVKNYLISSTMYMNKTTYLKTFSVEKINDNAIFANRGDISIKELNNELKDISGYKSSYDFKESSLVALKEVSGAFTMMSLIYIIMSFAMAFLVILNLLVTFVQEKKRELTILMINGYDRVKAKKYIYSDTIFLSIIGIIFGVGVGYLFGRLSIKTITSFSVYYITKFNVLAAILGATITAILVTAMSIISLRRINKFSLTEI